MDKKEDVSKNISMEIFNEPIVAAKVKELFSGVEAKIKRYLNMMLEAYEVFVSFMFPRDDLFLAFKEKCLKEILKEVSKQNSTYNKDEVVSSILSLLNEEKIMDFFFGEPQEEAFKDYVLTLSEEQIFELTIASEIVVASLDE